MSSYRNEHFGLGSEIAEVVVKEGGEETAELLAKEGAEALAKETAEGASKEAAEEAAEETSKKTIGETLKDGAKSAGEVVYKNPLKSLAAAGLAGTGIAALINKKSFGEQLGNEVHSVVKEGGKVAGEAGKTFIKVIMDFLKATFGPVWKTIKWVLLVIGVLIVIGILWKIVHLIKG
jgi:hypothetical protein